MSVDERFKAIAQFAIEIILLTSLLEDFNDLVQFGLGNLVAVSFEWL